MAKQGDPLAQILDGGNPGPLYLLYGKETFLVERGVEALKTRVLDPRTRDFNYEVVMGKELTAERIMSAARTLPMMARRRMVLVRDVDEAKSEALNGLLRYLTQPSAETCLVFTAEKVDARMKFYTAFKKAGVMVKLDPLYERQLPGFVVEEAKRRGVALDPGVTEALCAEIGAELAQLCDAIERLAVYVGERRRVTLEDVEAVVATTRQRTIFELCDAVGHGDRVRALGTLANLTANRESGVRAVALLARHVRQLAAARVLAAKRLNKFELAQALGMAPFFVDGIVEQARRLKPGHVERMHDALYRADRDLKSLRIDDARLLERLILELT